MFQDAGLETWLMCKRCVKSLSQENPLRMWGHRSETGKISVIGITSADPTQGIPILSTVELWKSTRLRFSSESGTWGFTHLLSQSLSNAFAGQSMNDCHPMTSGQFEWTCCMRAVIGQSLGFTGWLRADANLDLKSEWQCCNVPVT
jgi:hypothetical protein